MKMGRYLELAREALTDLERSRSGGSNSPEVDDSPSTRCDKSDISDKRVSHFKRSTFADLDDLSVQAAPGEAEQLGVPGKLACDLNVVEAARAAWVVGTKLDRLPEPVQGLVCSRDGWTPQRWADYLNYKAQRCEGLHADLAGRYRLVARLVGGCGHGT